MKKLYSWGVAAVLLALCIVACRDGYAELIAGGVALAGFAL